MIVAAALPFFVQAQDDLVKKLDANKSDSAKKKYVFKDVINLENTSIKNQASSGTCWSYSTNSFLESEMIRMGKKPVDLSEIYSARCEYLDKADVYVQLHGHLGWGDGGECHDVINMYAKYGAVPQSVYTGLNYGTTKNKFGEFQAVLKGMLDAVVANHNGKLTTVWKKAFTDVVDDYLGMWIIAGSLVAFMVSQLVDVWVFHRIKKVTGHKKVWLRATGSTIVSQMVDSFIVLFIAFYWGKGWSFQRVIAIGLVNYAYKASMAIILTPLIYIIEGRIEKFLGHEIAQELKHAAMGKSNE